MDETLQELENELANLRPRQVSRALPARIEAALAEGAGRTPSLRSTTAGAPVRRRHSAWFGWLAAAATLAVALTAVWWQTRPAPAAPLAPQVRNTAPVPPAPEATVAAGHYRPVGAASVLYDLRDEGDVVLDGGAPARRVRYRYVDTYTWKNPATNASLKWSVPREEVRVLPAVLH